MGGIISKPKVQGPSAAQLKAEADALKAQDEEKALLKEQSADEERKKIEEMQSMQKRKKGSRYGGMRSLLATREDAEIGVKKTTLG